MTPQQSLEQQDLLAVHRIREHLVSQRNGLCNQIRSLLGEYGIVLPQAIARLRREVPLVLEDAENELTVRGRGLNASGASRLGEAHQTLRARNRAGISGEFDV